MSGTGFKTQDISSSFFGVASRQLFLVMMVIGGLKFERTDADDTEAKGKNYRLVYEFVESYKILYEFSMCKDLLEFAPSSLESSQRFKDAPEYEKRCAEFVRNAAEIPKGNY